VVDDKGPAKPGGIEPGDVIVKFDGKDIKESRDLPRVVADAPVGKEVPVVVIRKGKEETKMVTLGRLEDGEKPTLAAAKPDDVPNPSVVKKTLGLELSNLSDDLRKKYKLKDGVKGVVITNVDANSAASEKRLAAGDVVVEVQSEPVTTVDAMQARLDQLKKEGKKLVMLFVTKADGNNHFVVLSLQ
jgi:serine protease Do